MGTQLTVVMQIRLWWVKLVWVRNASAFLLPPTPKRSVAGRMWVSPDHAYSPRLEARWSRTARGLDDADEDGEMELALPAGWIG